jgi:hypothetical protein
MLEHDARRIVAFIEANPEHFAVLRSVVAPFYRNQVAVRVRVDSTETVTSDGPGWNGVNRAARLGLAEEIACYQEWFPAGPRRFVEEISKDGSTGRTQPIHG